VEELSPRKQNPRVWDDWVIEWLSGKGGMYI
jgi:hypothetical protein